MSFDLSGKVALVTGGGRGMGAAIARCFACHGARVVIANRTLATAEHTAQSIRDEGGVAIACTYEARSRASNEEVVDLAIRQFGGIDILVHNAASITSKNLDSMDDQLLDEALDVNLKACFWLSKSCIPSMRRRGGGRILVTSSVTGPRVASFGMSHYAASKAGVNGFIRSAALELAGDRITVNGIEPGFIAQPEMGRTGSDEFSKKVSEYIPLGHIGTPDDIAYAMLYFASDEASYVTGQTLIVDGGAMLPENPMVSKPQHGPQ